MVSRINDLLQYDADSSAIILLYLTIQNNLHILAGKAFLYFMAALWERMIPK